MQRRMIGQGGGAKTDIVEAIQKLDALRKQGILTDDEFEEKKKDLLARL